MIKSLNDITDEELALVDKADIKNDPDLLISEGYLSIKTKSAELIKLIPNPAQTILLEVIKELKALNKPIRIWVLKARQEGISTQTEAYIYANTSQRDNINALIMADEKEHSSNLFEMSKLFHEQLEKEEPHLTPHLKKSNEKKLEFDGIHSQIIIATAENTEAARSHTYHYVHLSEVAFFRNLAAVMVGLNQSVPDLPNTMIIGETTANGLEMFYQEWVRAVEGKSDWYPLFIPWFWMPEYSLELADNKLCEIEGIDFTAEYTRENFITEEEQLQRDNNLTNEQINWRRWKISNGFKGDVNMFKQEYPSTWREAFIMSGRTFFSASGMDVQEKKLRKPIVGDIVYENMSYVFREMPTGRIKLYEKPVLHEDYIITADASEAIGQDEASVFVGNTRLNSTSAVVNGQYPPEELADLCFLLGNYYNKGLVVPENKGYGYMVCQTLFKKYGNIYRRKITKSGATEVKDELGFNTNSVTRPEMLARLAQEIKVNSCQVYDVDELNQMRTFIINPKNKKAEAAEGAEDGLVICRAIFSQARHEHPWKNRETLDAKREIAYERAMENRRKRIAKYRRR